MTGQPLDSIVEAIARTCHEPLREELPVIASISEEELGRHAPAHHVVRTVGASHSFFSRVIDSRPQARAVAVGASGITNSC